MKVLIVYVSAGAGHLKAAEAIYNYLKRHSSTIELKFIDVLDKSSFIFRSIYKFGYAFLITKVPLFWGWLFWITDFGPLGFFTRKIISILSKFNTREFAKLLIQENADFIISTHFLSSEISATLKSTGKIKSKLISVITDFGVHPFWIAKGTDLYVVGSGVTSKKN